MKKIIKIIVSFFVVVMLIPSFFVLVLIKGNGGSDANGVINLPLCIKEEMIIAAIECREKYGYPASVTIAQIIQESTGSNNGLSTLAYNYHNLFGIKAGSKWTGAICELKTKEQNADGAEYTITAKFRAYNSFKESIADRAELLKTSDYYHVEGITDAKGFANCLKNWATDIDYTETLIKIMDTYDLYKYDAMTVAEFKQSQTLANSNLGYIIVEKAKSRLGSFYVWGGGHTMEAIINPDQKIFDCSSYVCWSYYQSGINIGNLTTKQLINYGNRISKEEAVLGDIIMFSEYSGSTIPTHVGIYLGNGQMIHAPQPGDVVRIDNYSEYWKNKTLCFRRLY